MLHHNGGQGGTSLRLWTCQRLPRFDRNLKTWLSQKSRRGYPLRKYLLTLLLSAFVCLFGPWALALKGGTSLFGTGRHLAQVLNVSETAQIWSNSKTLALANVGRDSPTPQIHTTIAAECFCLFVWVMGPGFEGWYITIWANKASRSGFGRD